MTDDFQHERVSMIARVRLVLPPLSVLAGIAALILVVNLPREPERPAPSYTAESVDEVVAVIAEAEPEATPEPDPEPDPEPIVVAPEPPPTPESPKLDKAAVAKAEAALDEASRDRARAEARTDAAKREAAKAANQAALDASNARKLAFRTRDPSTRITRATARGGFLKAERDQVAAEVASLRSLPLPKATSILSKSPVSRPAGGDEYHFELRRGRVSFINLDRLMELAKSDAEVRVRMTDRTGVVTSQVGPVGWFSLTYVLGRATSGIEELLERRSIRFDLRGWEVVPTAETRGETYEATRNPISEYTRAINRLNPGRSVITMWIYPDSFGLYRQLRDELTDRGFSVAARPLPEGMAIRGSPLGSVSAAQ